MEALKEEVKQLRSRVENLEFLVLSLSKHPQLPLAAVTEVTTLATTPTTNSDGVIKTSPLPGLDSVFQPSKLPVFGNYNYNMLAELHIEEDILCLTISNNSYHLTSGSNNGEIVVFDLRKLKNNSIHQVSTKLPILCLKYNRNDSMLCVCNDYIISVFSCFMDEKYEHLQNISIHDNIVSSIIFTNDLNVFISVSHDCTKKVYSIHENKCYHSSTFPDIITNVQYNCVNNTYVIVAKNIKIYNFKNYQLVTTIENQDEIYHTASFNTAGTKLVSSGILTGNVKVWNCSNYDLIYSIALNQTSCVPVQFSKFNDQYIVYCKGSNNVSFIDTTNSTIVQNIGNIEEINCICHSEYCISYSTGDQKIKVYSIM